jgi:hypothetical protein
VRVGVWRDLPSGQNEPLAIPDDLTQRTAIVATPASPAASASAPRRSPLGRGQSGDLHLSPVLIPISQSFGQRPGLAGAEMTDGDIRRPAA